MSQPKRSLQLSEAEIRATYAEGEGVVVSLVIQLLERLNSLEAEVKELKGRLSQGRRNSSQPPSGDGFGQRTRRLRRQSVRLSGGQAGHPRQTLQWSGEPDRVERHPVWNLLRNLLECLHAHPASMLGFRQDFTIPFENNQAERDLPMMKLKQKSSGGFCSQAEARRFCRIRGHLATLRKQGPHVLDALIFDSSLGCNRTVPA